MLNIAPDKHSGRRLYQGVFGLWGASLLQDFFGSKQDRLLLQAPHHTGDKREATDRK
jgi:hypothetical protein